MNHIFFPLKQSIRPYYHWHFLLQIKAWLSQAGREKSLPARRGVRPQGEGGGGACPGRGRGGGKEECPLGGGDRRPPAGCGARRAASGIPGGRFSFTAGTVNYRSSSRWRNTLDVWVRASDSKPLAGWVGGPSAWVWGLGGGRRV